MEQSIKAGRVSCSVPSNIALVKYWGKKNVQQPLNPSLSFSLNNARTETTITFERLDDCAKKMRLDIRWHGQTDQKFCNKIEKYLKAFGDQISWANNYSFKVETANSFPHGAGIASSASGAGALALAMSQIACHINGETLDWRRVSSMARLASGSAARSFWSGYVVWGKSLLSELESSDEYGVRLTNIHQKFENYHDAILLVDSNEKALSSSEGHRLMANHTFANSRIEQANSNLMSLVGALRAGDQKAFIEIVENEALTLHALMMTSNPSYLLLKPASLKIIEEIRWWRKEYSLPVCFTIDAGPNIHLLYPAEYRARVHTLITERLAAYLENGKWIDDKMGTGPIIL